MAMPIWLRRFRMPGVILGVLATVTAIIALALWIFTRTEFGIERARRYTVGWLAGRVNGTLQIGRITSKGLLKGATLHDVSIIDPRGRPFLRADSMSFAYEWRTLAGGKIVLDRITLYRPEVELEQLPGEDNWNYEYVFPDTTPGDDRSLLVLEDVRIVDGRATVRFPWRPAEGVPVEPADTARLILESAPGGLVRVLRFENIQGRLPRVVWDSPVEDGKLIRVSELAGRGFVWKEAFELRDLQGTLTLRDSIVSFDAPNIRLPESRAALLGQVVIGGARNRFDIRITSQQVRLRDLLWLYPPLPAEGIGSGTMRIQTQEPKGTLWLAENARLRAPGSHITGSLGIVTGDTLYFTRVNLRAAPLDVRLLRQLIPGELPLDGLLVGTVTVEGPLSSLTTRGDLRLAERGAQPKTSAVRWSGTVDLRPPYALHDFEADVRQLELALVDALGAQLHLRGAVSGRLHATTERDHTLRFAASLAHEPAAGATSRIEASGRLLRGGVRPRIDADLTATSVALDALAATFPQLSRLQGEVRGPIRVSGPLDSLDISADLETSGGRLALDGQLDLSATGPRYRAQAQASGFQLHELVRDAPESVLTGRVAVVGAGRTLETAQGTLDIALEGGRLAGVALGETQLHARVQDGLAHVDTFGTRFSAGSASLRGSFGLIAGAAGTLEIGVEGDSLAALSAVLFPDEQDLEDGQRRRTGGRGRLQARLVGNVQAFELQGEASVRDLLVEPLQAQQVTARMRAQRLGSDSTTFSTQLEARELSIGGRPFDLLTARAQYTTPRGTLEVDLAAPGAQAYRLATDLHLVNGQAELFLRELRLAAGRERWELAAPTLVRAGSHGVELEPLELAHSAGAGQLRAAGRLPWRDVDDPAAAQPANLRVEVREARLAELLRVVQIEPAAGGTLNGRASVSGTASHPVLDADLAVTGLRYADVRMDRLASTLHYADRKLSARLDGMQDGRAVLAGEGVVPLDLTLAHVAQRRLAEPLHFTLRADSVPAALPLAFFRSFERVQGRLDGSVVLGGTTRDPVLGGSLLLRAGAMTWLPAGVRYQDINGTFRVVGQSVVAVDASVRGNGGRAAVTGALTFRPISDPQFDLVLRATDFEAARRRDVELTASGEVRLAGQYTRPRLSGHLRVTRGTLFLDEVWRQTQVVELGDPLLFDVVDTTLVAVHRILPASANPFLRNLVVGNATIEFGRDSWLRSRELNVEVTGELGVVYDRKAQDLHLTGTLDALRGHYQLYGRRFEVRHGTVEFVGTEGVDPNLEFLAVYRARTAQGEPLEIRAALSGTLRAPRVALASDAEPPISESDLVSYLVFGRPTYALAAGESRALSLATARALGAGLVAPSVFGYASAGLESVAQDLGLDYVAITATEAAQAEARQSSALGSLFGGTQVELGRYLSEDMFLAFTQRIVMGAPYREPGVRLEWRVAPNLTAELFAEDRFARTPSFGFEQTLDFRKVYGFFLFREWGY